MRDYDTGPAPEEPGRPARSERTTEGMVSPTRDERTAGEPGRAARGERTAEEPGRAAGIARTAADFANPAPLGLNVLAFATAILGCFYTGFIIPYQGIAIHPAVGAVLLISGIVLVIAGILEYRKNSMLSATLFTAYGAFLAVIGLVFMPNFGILGFLLTSGNINFALGLFFLCWAIFNGILFLGAMGVNMFLTATLLLLFVAYVALTVGQLAGNNSIANHVGGWLAIAAALAAWLTALTSLLVSEGAAARFSLPVGARRMTSVD